MQIALLGGTGDIGEGIALRLARDSDHDVIVGSRKEAKAIDAVTEYNDRLEARGHDVTIEGYDNETATANASVIVLSVPPNYAASTVSDVESGLEDGDVLVSPAVQMERDADGFHYDPPEIGSVTEAVAEAAPEQIPVIGAFHNIAAGALTDLDNDLTADVALTGNDDEAKTKTGDVVEAIDGLRALDAGGLTASPEVEAITPLLINLAMNNDGMHDLGVQFR